MPRPHPDFQATKDVPARFVFDGNVGEKATPGAFYCPKSDETLFGIAKRAYKATDKTAPDYWKNWINKNPYNQQTLVYRTVHATGACTSKKIDPAKGFIALCKNDRVEWVKSEGYKMPVLWIPYELGQMPKFEADVPTLKIKPMKANILDTTKPDTAPDTKPFTIIKKPAVPGDGKPTPTPTPDDKAPYVPASTAPSKTWMWVIGIGFVAIIAATVVVPMLNSSVDKTMSKGKYRPKGRQKGKGK